jgi:Ca-activated chloride channel family protein
MRPRIQVAIGILACMFAAKAQQQPRIRVDVRLVNVAFMARDSRGELITDLSRDDVEVFEDGIAQNVSFFARAADLPLSLALLVDASGSQEHFVKPHQRDLKAFLDSALTSRDRAILLCFGNHLRLASDFTSSAGDIVDGLDRFEHHMSRLPEIGPPDYRELGTAYYDAIYYTVSEKLSSEDRGRKAVILFSDGEDNSSAHHMIEVIEAAQAANAVVYNVRYTETRHGRLTARNKYGIRVMERISRDTGGADFDASKQDLTQAFQRIAEELRSSYEVAYHSSSRPTPGRFHNIEVRCKRPGVIVRAKTGYVDAGE